MISVHLNGISGQEILGFPVLRIQVQRSELRELENSPRISLLHTGKGMAPESSRSQKQEDIMR